MIDKEISEEAKRAVAEVSQRKARERLDRDGANSDDALRRRVRALAAERNLPPADIAKLMYKRIYTRDIMAFCKKHKVSSDWLLYGDLRGLHRMTQEAKAAPQETPEAQRKEIIALFSALSPRMQTVALGCIREALARDHL
jgi:NurA-like 5'-3' nuclease